MDGDLLGPSGVFQSETVWRDEALLTHLANQKWRGRCHSFWLSQFRNKALTDRAILENSILGPFMIKWGTRVLSSFLDNLVSSQGGKVEKERVKYPNPLNLEGEGVLVPLAPEEGAHSSRAQRVKARGLLFPPLLSSLPSSFFHMFFTNIKELWNFLFQILAR